MPCSKICAVIIAIGLTSVPALTLRAQQQPAAEKPAPASSDDPIARIKDEGLKRSKVMETLSYLTDVIGPRLTASPGLKRANEWTRDRLAGWGLENAHLESWGPFGRGWTLKRFNAQVIEPQCIPLIAYPKAWSPGLDGTLSVEVVYFDAKTETEFARFKGKLRGAAVLTEAPPPVYTHFEPQGNRKTDKQLLDLADAPEPPARGGFGGRGAPARNGDQAPGTAAATAGDATPSANGSVPANGTVAANNTVPAVPGPPDDADPRARAANQRARAELARKKLNFLMDEGAALMLEPSTLGDGGTLFVASANILRSTPAPAPGAGGKRVSVYDADAPKTLPQVVVSKEHYNRLVRMINQGETLKVAVDLAVEFHDSDPMGYNTVAEIPGTDLKDEVVMLGGHLDSWHSGTGATDNAAGVSAAMEAVRILKALDLKPRRTVRVALWTGEEQGLLGSRAYVIQHFGKAPAATRPGAPGSSTGAGESKPTQGTDQKAEFEKFSAYFNLDNGTGKIRGVYLQGNEAVRPTFRKWLQPFREMGATTLSLANTGGTDHQSFDGIGLPGFQFIQDEIEYATRTHHSNQDLFDRIQADDMKQASTIIAAFVFNAAMQDPKLPRKPTPAPRTTAASR